MSIVENIQAAIKSNKVIMGHNESVNYIKTNKPKTIVIANGIPANTRKKIEHNAKVSKTDLELFDGSSKELGIICGKPFPISVLVIKG